MTNRSNEPIFTRSFISIFLSNFFLFLTFYSLLTTLPIFVLQDLKGTEAQGGLVVTVFLISAIIVRPFSGRIIEKFGKKETLIYSMVLFMVSSFIYIWVDQLSWLLGLRFIHGIWFSLATTATGAIAADIVPSARRGEGMGYFVMSMNVAVVAGPFIGLTLLQSISFSFLFFILSLSMIGALIFACVVKVPKIEKKNEKRKLSYNDLFERNAIPIASVGLLVSFAYSSVIAFISVYTKSLDLLDAASYFFVIFAVSMLISRPFVGRLFDSKGPNVVIYPSLIIFACGLFLLGVTDTFMMLMLSGLFIGVGYGSIVPCFQTIAIQSAGKTRSSHATATFFTFFDTGIATGSYVLGIIVSMVGFKPLYIGLGFFLLMVNILYKQLHLERSREVNKA